MVHTLEVFLASWLLLNEGLCTSSLSVPTVSSPGLKDLSENQSLSRLIIYNVLHLGMPLKTTQNLQLDHHGQWWSCLSIPSLLNKLHRLLVASRCVSEFCLWYMKSYMTYSLAISGTNYFLWYLPGWYRSTMLSHFGSIQLNSFFFCNLLCWHTCPLELSSLEIWVASIAFWRAS